jgi:hypothetical protein
MLDKPFTIMESAKYFNITIVALYSMTSRCLITFTKPGKRLYFLKSVLNAWVKQIKNKPTDEIIEKIKINFGDENASFTYQRIEAKRFKSS